VTYKVALCGLTARDERLIEIVITRAPNPKYPYQVGSIAALGEAHIAVIDVASVHGENQLAELRALNQNVVAVFLSDLGLTGDSRYRLERRSLLLRINRVLDEVVESELLNTSPAKASALQKTTVAAVVPPKSDNAFVGAAVVLEQAPLQPLRALIVDDSLTVREQLRSALDRAGIVSDQADCAENAFSKLQSNNYDIVFLDVVMPGADGYEVCRTIKKNAYTRSVPVLMLTSRSSPFDRARGALAGCDSYLVKPITWETFFTAVDKVLAKHFRNDRALLTARGYRAALAG
jgi:two-component system, cell cycle response regulator